MGLVGGGVGRDSLMRVHAERPWLLACQVEVLRLPRARTVLVVGALLANVLAFGRLLLGLAHERLVHGALRGLLGIDCKGIVEV